MNQNTNAAKNAPKPLISEDVETQLMGAYKTILRLMNGYGETIAPTVEQAGRPEYERAAARGLIALNALQAHRKEQEVAAFRQGVKDAIAPHLDRAREEKAEFDSLSPSLRAKLGAFPTFVLVPLADVAAVFEGASEPDMVKRLNQMSYKVNKSPNGAYSLKIDLPKSILETVSA